MVGSVITEINGTPAFDSRASAALVLAICISDNKASCIRAPPLAEKHTSGTLWSRLALTARTKRSPTTEPMEPPMYLNSKAAATSGTPSTCPRTTTMASVSPVAFCACFMRSTYFLLSLNFKGSAGCSSAPISSRGSGSRNRSRRLLAPMRM